MSDLCKCYSEGQHTIRLNPDCPQHGKSNRLVASTRYVQYKTNINPELSKPEECDCHCHCREPFSSLNHPKYCFGKRDCGHCKPEPSKKPEECECHCHVSHAKDEYCPEDYSCTHCKREDGKGWEEELLERFTIPYGEISDSDGEYNGWCEWIEDIEPYEVIDFISDTLKSEEKRVRRETLEGLLKTMRVYREDYPNADWDEAMGAIMGYKFVKEIENE